MRRICDINVGETWALETACEFLVVVIAVRCLPYETMKRESGQGGTHVNINSMPTAEGSRSRRQGSAFFEKGKVPDADAKPAW